MSSTTDPSGDRGQVLALFAISIVTLLLVAALAFDVGMVLVERRDQQNAADAASLAGARYILTSGNYAGPCSGAGGNAAVAAACDIAEVNGFDDAAADEVVNVYIPPQHGRFVGLPGFIEVQIEATRPSIFAGVIGRTVWPVGSFAVAADAPNVTFPFSMLALNPTACKAIHVSGTGLVYSLSNIHSNSNGSEPADCGGIGLSRTGGGTIDIDSEDAACRSAGSIQSQGSGTMDCIPDPNSFVLPDPLQFLSAPPQPTLPTANIQHIGPAPTIEPPRWCPGTTDAARQPSLTQNQPCDIGSGPGNTGQSWVLSPGLYPHGIEVTSGNTAYLLPGVYWIGGGGFRIANGSVVSVDSVADAETDTWGGGVLIYNSTLPAQPAGAIKFDGSIANMKLRPLAVPTGDPLEAYNGIVIFQDRTLTLEVALNGSASTAQVLGIIYVPGGRVKLNGNGGTLTVDQIIADTFLIDGGGGTINVLRNTGVDAVISGAGLVD